MADKDLTFTTELSKDGGGFLFLELVPKASIGKLGPAGSTRPVGAHLEVPLLAKPLANLPPEPVPCLVRWQFGQGAFVEGGGTDLDGGSGAVTPRLELTSEKLASAGLGGRLESGGTFTVEVTPDHPYVEPAKYTLANANHADLPELSLTLSWHGETGKKLGEVQKSQSPLRIGDRVALELKRTRWRCYVRLLVSTPLDDGHKAETVIDFETGGTQASWHVGYDHDVLTLPAAQGKKTTDIRYDLALQVSEDGMRFGTIRSNSIHVACPALAALSVILEPGVQASVAHGEVDWTSFDDAMDLIRGHHIAIAGRFTGLAPNAAVPFALELWAYNAAAPGFMHPVVRGLHVGELDEHSAFYVQALPVISDAELALVRGVELFAVLRASTEVVPPALPSSLAHGALRLFADEDFAPKPPGQGLASIGKSVEATREPVVQKMWWEIDRASNIVVSCSVLGSEKTWKDQATFVFGVPGTARAKELAARYKASGNGGGHGVLSAALAFSDAKPIAGAHVTVTLESKMKATVAPGGETTEFDAKPKITGVTWTVDQDAKKRQRIHIVCTTSFFPRDGKNLDVVLQKPGKTAGEWVPVDGDVVSYGPAKNVVDSDGKLEAFVYGDAKVLELSTLLATGQAKLRVARPKGAEKLYKIDGFAVEPWPRETTESAPAKKP